MITARIIDWSLRQSKNNNLMVQVLFQTADDMNYTWRGSLKEGTAWNITMSTLKKLGCNPNVDLKILNRGPEGGALNQTQEFELELEQREYNGQMYTSVKTIRMPGESPLGNRMSDADLDAALKGQPTKKTGTTGEEIPF